MKGRYRAISPVTDFSISQKIRVALVEDGRTDLAIESITQPVRELEEELALARRDIRLLQESERKRVTETGVNRLIDAKVGKVAVNWGSWGIRLLVGAALTAAGAGLFKFLKAI